MARDTNSRARAAERQAKALELRKAGWTYDRIADAVGYANRGSAQRAVEAALDKITREPAQQLLTLQLEQLGEMWAGVYEQATKGDVFAIDRALKIMERTGKLAGIDQLGAETSQQQAAIEALNSFMAFTQSAAAAAAAAAAGSPDDDGETQAG